MIAPIVLVLIGLALAFAGHRLVWLLVGAAGFIVGYKLVDLFLPFADDMVLLVIGIIVGLIAGWLATRFVSILVKIAAFILVGNVAIALVELFGVTSTLWIVVAFFIGGLIGLGLVRFALDLALILISAVGGAAMVTQGLPALLNREPGTFTALIGLVVLVAGILVQYRGMQTQSES
jgi:hypothetical protein